MKTRRKEAIIVPVIVGVGLLLFAFFDLSFSLTLYRPESIFGLILEAFGEWPAFLAGVFGGAMLFVYPLGKTKGKRLLSRIGGACLMLLGSGLAAMMSFLAFKITNAVLMVLVMVVLMAGGIFLVKRIPSKSLHNIRQIAILGAVLFLSTMIVFNTIKMSWGRMRFRDMMPPYSGFTPWYLPQGFSSDNTYMSFPSGHAAWASVILTITLLPLAFPRLKTKERIVNAVAYIWIIAVSLSRVIVGAHFASDVIVGFFITWLLFQLWKKVFIIPKRMQEIE